MSLTEVQATAMIVSALVGLPMFVLWVADRAEKKPTNFLPAPETPHAHCNCHEHIRRTE